MMPPRFWGAGVVFSFNPPYFFQTHRLEVLPGLWNSKLLAPHFHPNREQPFVIRNSGLFEWLVGFIVMIYYLISICLKQDSEEVG